MKKKEFVASVMLCAAIHGVSAQVTMNIDLDNRGAMLSAYQYGIFFEEINHAGEGGLYGEMIENRSFESPLADEQASWRAIGGAEMTIVTDDMLNAAQCHAARVDIKKKGGGVANSGFWGMAAREGENYRLTFFARGSSTAYTARLVSGRKVVAEAKGNILGGQWKRNEVTMKARANADSAFFQLIFDSPGTVVIDVVSLMPLGDWYPLRADLARRVSDMRPSFMRFPGGCYVEGVKSYGEAFRWKQTIGPTERRPGHFNRNWGYWVSDGMGYDEFLSFCERIGAAPLFVVNVGLGHKYQIPLDSLLPLIDDCLDAIEYANGDTSATWGRKRAKNGHPLPYNLRFIEIGNENYQADARIHSQQYADRYIRFYKAIKSRFPDIITIGNVDAWGHDDPLWLNLHPVEIVDEHYYRTWQWMRDNYTKYDERMRNFLIYNGEYAANGSGKGLAPKDICGAVGEAIYMMGMERNSDICRMASFAPMFMNVNDSRWKYDMIYYNCSENYVTPSYYVQQMMMTNTGRQNVIWTESGNTDDCRGTRRLYQSVTVDDSLNILYVKVANPDSVAITLSLIVTGGGYDAVMPSAIHGLCIKGTPGVENNLRRPYNVKTEETITDSAENIAVPPYSFNIYKIDIKAKE